MWEVRTPDGIGEVCSACAHLFETKRQMPAVVVKVAPVTAQMDLFG